MRILISAGEASGEHYGAQLMAEVRRLEPTAEFFGLGGEQMRAAGFQTVVDAKNVAVVGLAEVVRHLPAIYGEFKKLLRAVDQDWPDVAVLIDFPDFNFRLAKELHRRGIPVVYFVSPQLWAWRQGRLKLVQRYVKKMLVIFPFEEAFYRERGVEVEYVGHPLAEAPLPQISREEFARENGLDLGRDWISLLPGSRRGEIERHLGTMVKAADILGHGYEYLIPVASTLSQSYLKSELAKHTANASGIRIHLVRDARAAMLHSRASVVASGTATVEAALVGKPFVVVYRLAPLTWKLGRRLVKLERFAMPNLIAGEEVVPELIQHDFTGEKVVAALKPLLAGGPERERMKMGLARVRELLQSRGGQSALARAAREIATLGARLRPGLNPNLGK